MASKSPSVKKRSSKTSSRASKETCPKMYLGFTSPEHLLDLWRESHRDDPGETRAAELWRTLHSDEETKLGETTEALPRELWELHEKGARIATYAVAQGKLSGTFLPADPEEAERLLHKLCDDGFPAAFAQLLKDVRLENPEQRTPCSEQILDLITKGAELELDCALVLQGQSLLKGWIVLDPSEARGLAIRLLNAARNGCWEALHTLLQIYANVPPDAMPEEFLKPVLELLQAAARADWTEAMYVLGSEYLQATVLPLNLELGKKLLFKAWLKGSLDAGCLYSELMVAQKPSPKTMKQVREILEKCCSLKHPRAMLSMSDFIMHKEGGYSEESVEYLKKGAELGLSEPYVAYLWLHLMREARELRDCRKSMYLKELTAPLLVNDLCARHRVALFTLMTSNRKPAVRARAMAELEDCARQWYAPAAVSLAEILTLGLYGQKADASKARIWLGRAHAQHEPRAVSLKVLQELERCQGLSLNKRLEKMYAESPSLKWASQKKDALATAMTGLLIAGMADTGLLGTAPKTGALDPLKQQARDILLRGYTLAISIGDITTLLYLAKQFTKAQNLGLYDDLARQLCTITPASGKACALMARMFIQLVKPFDESSAYRLEKALRG